PEGPGLHQGQEAGPGGYDAQGVGGEQGEPARGRRGTNGQRAQDAEHGEGSGVGVAAGGAVGVALSVAAGGWRVGLCRTKGVVIVPRRSVEKSTRPRRPVTSAKPAARRKKAGGKRDFGIPSDKLAVERYRL